MVMPARARLISTGPLAWMPSSLSMSLVIAVLVMGTYDCSLSEWKTGSQAALRPVQYFPL